MANQWLLSPPAAFIIIFFAAVMLSLLFSRLAFRPSKKEDGSRQPYACGEDGYNHMAQPDYSNFFPFAFFFTLAHVATLIITTTPVEDLSIFAVAAIYIIGAVVGLYVLFKR